MNDRRQADRRGSWRRFQIWTAVFTGLSFLGVITLGGISLIIALEQPWLTYVDEPFEPTQPTFSPGETVTLRVTRCNNDQQRQVYTRVSRLIRLDADQLPYTLPSGVVMIDPGCHTTISTVSTIPSNAPPGRYYIEGTAQVEGTIRTFLVRWSSKSFEVGERNARPLP